MIKTITKSLLAASLMLSVTTVQAQTVSTVVGVVRTNSDAQNTAPYDNSTTTPAAARLVVPNGIAFDYNSNIMYITEWHKIRVNNYANVYNRAGNYGDPNFARAFWDGTGNQSRMSEPAGMIVLPDNTMIFCDEDNHAIRKMQAFSNLGNQQVVQTLAGDETAMSQLNGYGIAGTADGTGSAASFNKPTDLAMDKDGYIYICDKFNNSIRRMEFVGGNAVITTFAGLTGEMNTGTTDGVGTAARFNTPTGIAYNPKDHSLIVADYFNGSLRKIDIATKTVSTLLPNNKVSTGYVDGDLSVAKAHLPYGVTVDADGNIFFTERQRGVIRKISTSGTVSTVAGVDDQAGHKDGDGATALFAGPERIVYNSADKAFYITDWNNSVIRKLVMPGTADFSVDATSGTTNTVFKFTDLTTDNPTAWSWSFSPDNAVYVGGTGANTQNPEVKFSSQGIYSVTLTVVTAGGTLNATKTDLLDVSSSASISNLTPAKFDMSIYPNPSNGIVNVEISNASLSRATISIVDVSGRVVYNQTNVSGTNTGLDLTGLKAGIYFVSVVNNGEIATQKIIIE